MKFYLTTRIIVSFLMLAVASADEVQTISNVQYLIIATKEKITKLNISRSIGSGRAETIVDIAGKDEEFRVFVDGLDAWIWNEKCSWRIYRIEPDGGVKIIDPLKEKISFPELISKYHSGPTK